MGFGSVPFVGSSVLCHLHFVQMHIVYIHVRLFEDLCFKNDDEIKLLFTVGRCMKWMFLVQSIQFLVTFSEFCSGRGLIIFESCIWLESFLN